MEDREPTRLEYREAIDMICESIGISVGGLRPEGSNERQIIYRLYRGEYKNSPSIDAVETVADALGFSSVTQFKRYCINPRFNGAIGVRSCIEIGGVQTLWHRRVGTGERGKELHDKNIKITLTKREPSFGSVIDLAIAQTRNRIIDGKFSVDGLKFDNNRMLALFNVSSWPPVGPNEDRTLSLTVGVSDYSAFWTMLNMPLAKRERMTRLRGWDPNGEFDPLFGLGLGINVAILTRDDKMIFGVRAMTQGARRDELDTGSVEGISYHKDFGDGISLKNVAYRGG